MAKKNPTLFTQSTIKAALRDHRARLTKEWTDRKADGLQIRIRPTSCRFSVRGTLHGKQHRYDLGDVVEGDDALAEARSRAGKVREMLRRNINPDQQVAVWLTGVSLDNQLKLFVPPPPAERPSWTWETAKANFLAFTLDHRRPATHRDYKGKLNTIELDRFAGRRVADMGRNEIIQAVTDINKRGVEDQAKGVKRTLSRMWNWLADGPRQEETSVTPNLLLEWSNPESNKKEIGDPMAPAVEVQSDVPPEIMLGRTLAISRMNVLPPQQSLGVQLWLATAQRRRTVIEAGRFHFKDTEVDQIWMIPPYFRKSGSKRGDTYHLVPVVGFGLNALKQLDKLADVEDSKGWLFPRAKDPSRCAPIDLLNHALYDMPGVDLATHQARYALGSYGERDLGYAPSEAKLILDHLEGVDAKDVTGTFYSTDPNIQRKREKLLAWVAWLEEWAARAIDADPLLLDREYLFENIYKKRHGDDKLEKRIEYRKARGLPLWPGVESVSDAKATEMENMPPFSLENYKLQRDPDETDDDFSQRRRLFENEAAEWT